MFFLNKRRLINKLQTHFILPKKNLIEAITFTSKVMYCGLFILHTSTCLALSVGNIFTKLSSFTYVFLVQFTPAVFINRHIKLLFEKYLQISGSYLKDKYVPNSLLLGQFFFF